MKISISDFINPNVINIFTDASMWPQKDNTMIGCYGFLTMYGNQELNYGLYIDSNSTVNKCEIKGIKYAVFEAVRLRFNGFSGTINIFSDSQISVFGIRDWIYSWTFNNNSLINSSGNEVANQSEFIEIMQTIIKYRPNINFYHQNGHINTSDKSSVFKAANTFIKSNFSFMNRKNLDIEFIKYISICNNEIDNRTRWHLRHQSNALTCIYQDAFRFIPTNNYVNEIENYKIIMEENKNDEERQTVISGEEG